jgi:hypothetical protein
VTISEFAMLNRHQQSDRLRRGVHRPNDHRFDAGTKSSTRNPARSRDRHGAWTGGKQCIAVDADHFFDIGLGVRRRKLRARLSQNRVAYWSAKPHPANSAMAQASTLIAIFIAGMGREPWSAGWTARFAAQCRFFMSGQPGRELR